MLRSRIPTLFQPQLRLLYLVMIRNLLLYVAECLICFSTCTRKRTTPGPRFLVASSAKVASIAMMVPLVKLSPMSSMAMTETKMTNFSVRSSSKSMKTMPREMIRLFIII